MEKSFPFNAVVTDGVPDRVYAAEDFAAERAAYVSNGVTSAGALALTPAASGGLAADAAPGIAVIDGYTYFNTAPLTLACAAADAALPRIDLAVLRLDLDARHMRCILKTGTPAETPVPPAPVSTATAHEMPLAEIRVAPGAAALAAADITDRRVRADYLLNKVDTDALLASYQTMLDGYFGAADAAALRAAANTVRTDAGASSVLCGDGAYRAAVLDGWRFAELARFTSSGTFRPAEHPARDGLYDVILIGGGGSGASGSADWSYGGGAGYVRVISGLPLRAGASYAVTVGAGGASVSSGGGKPGGASSFAGFTAPGGAAGLYSGTESPAPAEKYGYTAAVGTSGTSGAGGASPLAAGGQNSQWTPGSGSLGSGGGAGIWPSTVSGRASGAGGGGAVIIRGALPV